MWNQAMGELIPLTAIILSVGGPLVLVAFVFYHYFKTRNRERLSLIEKGLDPSFLYSKKKSDNNGFGVVRFGLLLVGVALGLIFGYLLNALTPFNDVAAYMSMILLFGGGGLIVSYVLEQKKLQSKKEDES